MQSLPNGIVHLRDWLYVADSVIGAIWRVADTRARRKSGRAARNWRRSRMVQGRTA
jgi:hypothetical protein